MKKVLSVFLIFVLCSSLLAACAKQPSTLAETNDSQPTAAPPTEAPTSAPDTETKPSKKEKSIDLYIIAGQSNASGYTTINKTELASLWSHYQTGVDTVLYTGRANSDEGVEIGWTTAKAGQGKSTDCMGVEVGMAKVLSENYYNTQNSNGTVAGIIKFAHGGTSLLNNTQKSQGNWISPTYASRLGLNYTGLTGELYRGLLDQVEKSVTKLKVNGYTVINLKGVFWMQGEDDRGYPTEYKTAFKYFVKDLRQDLGEIMKTDLSKLPIMIGEISQTFAGADAGNVATNEKFIAVQRRLAVELSNVYVIASGQYEINHWNAQTQKSENGQDPYHWTTKEIFAIGELVGRCIVDQILNKTVT